MPKYFQVGDIVRLNPDAKRFIYHVQRFGLGPFEVVKRNKQPAGWQQMDVKDISTGQVHTGWGAEIDYEPEPEIILDTFMDAVKKAVKHAKAKVQSR